MDVTTWHHYHHIMSLLTEVLILTVLYHATSECFSLPLKLGRAEMENQEERTSDHFAIWKKGKDLFWGLFKTEKISKWISNVNIVNISHKSHPHGCHRHHFSKFWLFPDKNSISLTQKYKMSDLAAASSVNIQPTGSLRWISFLYIFLLRRGEISLRSQWQQMYLQLSILLNQPC